MKTIKAKTKIEFEERKSKFIGYIKPVTTKEEAEKYIEEIKNKHKDATHNCSAYKVIENGQEYFKVDDDGEPKGTSGKPMGEILTYMEIDNVVVIATRYFGGIKLGAGGLVRAYAKTAKLSVQASEIIEYVKKEIYLIEFSYDKVSEIDKLLNDKENIIEKGYNDKVFYKVNLSEELFNKINKIREVSIIKL
ncbi:MAG: YigZ family protein [Fusobacterium sp. JB021]|nr:YigZ family protein [Fusobacterium sp. JB020]MDP0493159.1 YigZ family protein [Fusobacterium sp. JB021]